MEKHLKGIKNIIFDFGGVIINIDFELTYKAFEELGITGVREWFKHWYYQIFKENNGSVTILKELIQSDKYEESFYKLIPSPNTVFASQYKVLKNHLNFLIENQIYLLSD